METDCLMPAGGRQSMKQRSTAVLAVLAAASVYACCNWGAEVVMHVRLMLVPAVSRS